MQKGKHGYHFIELMRGSPVMYYFNLDGSSEMLDRDREEIFTYHLRRLALCFSVAHFLTVNLLKRVSKV